MKRWSKGIGDFQCNEVVNIIPPQQCNIYTYMFGIPNHSWDEAIANNPHIISSIEVDECNLGWSGYKIETESGLSSKYIWPYWAFERVNPVSTKDVSDLL